jgi:hypothetical protein
MITWDYPPGFHIARLAGAGRLAPSGILQGGFMKTYKILFSRNKKYEEGYIVEKGCQNYMYTIDPEKPGEPIGGVWTEDPKVWVRNRSIDILVMKKEETETFEKIQKLTEEHTKKEEKREMAICFFCKESGIKKNMVPGKQGGRYAHSICLGTNQGLAALEKLTTVNKEIGELISQFKIL